MSPSRPVVRVVEMLTSVGYRDRTEQKTIASVPFDLAALLVGSDHANDLVVVIDTLIDDDETRVRQKIEGLSRALDLVGSRRSLTVVLVGPPPRQVIIEALARVSRVLVVGTPMGESADLLLKEKLAVLLPLSLPDATGVLADPLMEVRKQLPSGIDEDCVERLLTAASVGTEAVTETLRQMLDSPFDIVSEESPT
jgi:hypothetical protein